MIRVAVIPDLFRWARERSGVDVAALTERFPKYEAWENGESKPTLKQLEDFSRKTLTPFGYFFLAQPPEEQLPIPDFRTLAGREPRRLSAQLLETIYTCQRRQDWYRDYAVENGLDPLAFVKGSRVTDGVQAVANSIRETIGLDPSLRAEAKDAEAALSRMFAQVEDAGILVMRNGIVGNNVYQPLSVSEFRGFALSDPYAPLIFINAADSKAAQMFTLAHELAHLWIGASGISNLEQTMTAEVSSTEAFCNGVAAESLVALDQFRAAWRLDADPVVEYRRLGRLYRVSSLVIIRRAYDAGFLSREDFSVAYCDEVARLERHSGGGGDFYKTQISRLGTRFPKALLVSTLEGRTFFRDAYRLLGISKSETFDKLAKELNYSL